MRGVSGNDKKKHLRWYVCVQPAREFDWDSLYNDQMVLMLNADEKNYASDRAIEMARDWYDANILLLWGRIWKGYNEDGKFEPSDPEALKRNIDTAHRLGMKVIAYTQELPGKQPIGAAGFLKGMAKAKTYGLDGLYFDGGARGGWEDNLVMLREARRLYRDGILVMHGNPRALSVYLDYVHYGEHRTSLEEVAQSLSMQEKSRWAIGGIIENAPGMNEEMIDNIIESNSILRCGLMYVYCDDGFLPGAGFTWDDRFLRLYRDYFLPKFRLKGLDYKYKNNLIAKAEFQDKSAKFQKQIQDHLAYKKALEQSPKVPPGLTPVSTEVSSILDPRYNLWLSTGPQAVDGLISTVWVGGSAMPGTILGRPAGKPEDGVGEWIKLDFGKQVMIANILYDTTYPGYEKQIWQEAFTISGSVDGKNWVVLASKRDLTQPQRFTFRSGAVVRYVQVHNILSHFEGYPNWRLAYVTELQVYPDK
jgi:hypothetical protein